MIKILKSFVFCSYLLYKKYFPVERGKDFISRLLNKLFGSFIVKVDNGIILEVFINSSMDLSYIEDKGSTSKMESQIANLKEGDVFVDVGANIGYFSIIASQKVGKSGKVYSFEPSRREYVRLLKNIDLNKASNIVPFNVALSNSNKELEFWVAEGHTGLNRIAVENLSGGSNISVPAFRMDYILDIEKIDLLKIDVEGAEYLVLDGMSEIFKKCSLKILVIEITQIFLEKYGHSKKMIYDLMEKNGFSAKINSDEWQYDEFFQIK